MRHPESLSQDILKVGLVHQLACELGHHIAVALQRLIELLHVVDWRHGLREGVLADISDVLLVVSLAAVYHAKKDLIVLL